MEPLTSSSRCRINESEHPDRTGSAITAALKRAWSIVSWTVFCAAALTAMVPAAAQAQECIDYDESMRWIGGMDTPGSARAVVTRFPTAYVADDDSGIHVIDISYPAAPQITSTFVVTGSAADLAVAGDYAYVAAGEQGLQIVHLTSPADQATRSVSAPAPVAGTVWLQGAL